jgi:hypothetical protein
MDDVEILHGVAPTESLHAMAMYYPATFTQVERCKQSARVYGNRH